MTDTDQLRSHPFMQYFPPDLASALVATAVISDYEANAVIFEEGDAPTYLYLVLSGTAAMVKQTAEGKFHPIVTVAKDGFFGEFGALDGSGRSTRAIAVDRLKLACVPGDDVRAVLKRAPGTAALNVTLEMVSRLRATNKQYVNEIVRKEKLSLIGEMANSIIHDFKTPFSVIIMATAMLRDCNNASDRYDYCTMIDDQIDTMRIMTEEILEFCRGISRLERKSVDIATVLTEFHALNQMTLKDSGIDLKLDVAQKVVNIDSAKIKRALQNIVNNAVDALKDSGTITVQCTALADGAEVCIIDDGPGVPEQIREGIFEPFVTFGKDKGTGLGMAITKSVIDAHQGTIALETQSGVGTCFRIVLPSKPSSSEAHDTAS